MQLPSDDFILLSYVNTKLRDECFSLADFCADYGVSESDLVARLSALGYKYDSERNAFIRS